MTPAFTSVELGHVERLLEERFGLSFDPAGRDRLIEALSARVSATRAASAAEYLATLDRPGALQALAEALSVPESYFFRGKDHWRAFAASVLPDRAAARAGAPVRLLSAGCASGEEPYTMAMVASELGIPVSIHGIDLAGALLDKAKAGRYSEWSLRETPAEARERWFESDGRESRLDEGIVASVRFSQRNLLDQEPSFWQPESFDVVFCRNVFIYFTPQAMAGVIARLSQTLAPGGFLFLGHSETLRGVSHAFHLRHTHEAFYYQLRSAAEASLPSRFELAAPPTDTPWAAPIDGSWAELIQQSSDRIAELAGRHAPRGDSAGRPPRAYDQALELFRRERFDEAAALMGSASEADADALLLHAVILHNRGDVVEAERLARLLLGIDELDVGAHYLVAVCREHRGDAPRSVEHARTAVYLDPAFALAHLQLGRLARRRGDHEEARRALGHAIGLLAREDAFRVLLFGGGFSREDLVQLCRAELAACGALP